MALMKVKNGAGEWVSAGSADLMSEMRIAIVEDTSDTLSYDLSPYIKGNDNFILFFVCEYGTAATGANFITALIHMDDVVKVSKLTTSESHWRVDSLDSIFETLDYSSSYDIDTWEDIFTWNEETCVLTFVRPVGNYHSMGDKALLLYTGIKEA